MDHSARPAAGGTALDDILDAVSDYRDSLLQLYDRLDIMRSYAGPPEYLIARLIVAELVGGVALPAKDYSTVGVIGAEGERITVLPVNDRDGFWQSFRTPSDPKREDAYGIVVFINAQPVAAHIIPVDRLSAVSDGFALERRINMESHMSFVLDSEKAEALGVVTYDLSRSPA